MPSPIPCSPVIREWLWKKTEIEKKSITKAKRRWKKTAGTPITFTIHVFILRKQVSGPSLKCFWILRCYSSKCLLSSFLFRGDLKNTKLGNKKKTWNLKYRTYKYYFNGKKNLYSYKLNYKILNIANEVTKAPRKAKKVDSILRKVSFFVVPEVPLFLSAKFLINRFLIKHGNPDNILW